MAFRAAVASPDRCCAAWRPEAAPSVNSDTTTRATTTVAPTTLRRPLHGRRELLGVLIFAPFLLSSWAGARSEPSLFSSSKAVKKQQGVGEPFDGLVGPVLPPKPVHRA